MMHQLGRLALLLILLCVGLSVSAQETLEDVIVEAENAYNDGDYLTAITLYEALRNNGFESGALYYNLGSAYFRSDDLGYALLNYLRAQQFTPRDTDLETNLFRVRALRVDIQGDTVNLLDALGNVTTGFLTTSEFAWIALILWTLACTLIALWFLLRKSPRRESLRLAALIALGVAFFVVTLMFIHLHVKTQRPLAVITAFEAPVYTGPGGDYVEIFTLFPAAEMRLLESHDNWGLFLLPDGRQGWIAFENVETVQPSN